jgi:hypothetical protein
MTLQAQLFQQALSELDKDEDVNFGERCAELRREPAQAGRIIDGREVGRNVYLLNDIADILGAGDKPAVVQELKRSVVLASVSAGEGWASIEGLLQKYSAEKPHCTVAPTRVVAERLRRLLSLAGYDVEGYCPEGVDVCARQHGRFGTEERRIVILESDGIEAALRKTLKRLNGAGASAQQRETSAPKRSEPWTYHIVINADEETRRSALRKVYRTGAGIEPEVVTVSEFVQRLLGFENLAELVRAQLGQDRSLEDLYKPLPCERHDAQHPDEPSSAMNVDELVDKWLTEESSRLLVVLGGFGTGKTTFLAHTAARLAASSTLTPSGALAFLLKLGDLPLDADGSRPPPTECFFREVLDRLSDRWNFFNLDVADPQEFFRCVPSTLVLDALDEAVDHFDKDAFRNIQESLQSLLQEDSPIKIILSLRPEMFYQLAAAHNGTVFDLIIGGFSEIGCDPWFVKLMPFSQDTLKELLPERVLQSYPESEPLYQGRLDRARVLLESVLGKEAACIDDAASGRPVIIKMMADWIASEAAHGQELETLAELPRLELATRFHDAVIEGWAARETDDKGRKLLSKDQKRQWLRRLAERLALTEAPGGLKQDDVLDLLHDNEPDRGKDGVLDRRRLDYEVLLASFLDSHRGSDSVRYSFLFPSFCDYAFAEAVVTRINDDDLTRFGRHQIRPLPATKFAGFLKAIATGQTDSGFVLDSIQEKLREWMALPKRKPILKRQRSLGDPVNVATRYARLGNNRYLSANALLVYAIVNGGQLRGLDLSGTYIGDSIMGDDLLNAINAIDNEQDSIETIDFSNCDFRCTLVHNVRWKAVSFKNCRFDATWFHRSAIEAELDIDTHDDGHTIVTPSSAGDFLEARRQRWNSVHGDHPEPLDQLRGTLGKEPIGPDNWYLFSGGDCRIGLGEESCRGDGARISRSTFSVPEVQVTLAPVLIAKQQTNNTRFANFVGTDSGKKWDGIEKVVLQLNAEKYLEHWDEATNRPHLGPMSRLSPGWAPVVNIPFYAAVDFADAQGCRLPTQAEFEATGRELGIDVILDSLSSHKKQGVEGERAELDAPSGRNGKPLLSSEEWWLLIELHENEADLASWFRVVAHGDQHPAERQHWIAKLEESTPTPRPFSSDAMYFVTLIRDWCLDRFSVGYEQLERVALGSSGSREQVPVSNPLITDFFVPENFANDIVPARWKSDGAHVVRGIARRRTSRLEYKTPMEPVNCNEDIGFRLVREVWQWLPELYEQWDPEGFKDWKKRCGQ